MITQAIITDLLLQKHSEAFCVPQCKTGPTYARGLGIIDFWVMEKSWAHPRVIAYEIKCSRQDFMHDQKWGGYLEFCNEMYFAAPPGIIHPNELPPEIGLLETSVNGVRLFTKKKAVYRDITVNETIFRYILMSRASTKSENNGSAIEFWRKWLEGKIEDREFGYHVSRKIREKIDKDITIVREENERLKNEQKMIEKFKHMLSANGIPPEKYNTSWKLRNIMDDMNNGIPGGFVYQLKHTIENLQKILDNLKTEEEVQV